MTIKIPDKKTIAHEIKEVLSIIIYLAIALSLIATFKALVLFQLDIYEFEHLYIVALIEALVLGKVVAITQNLPVMNALDQRPLIWSVTYKAIIMTMIIDIANTFEDKFFAHSEPHGYQPLHPIVFWIAHQILSFFVFFILYAARGLDRKLGQGRLLKLLIEK